MLCSVFLVAKYMFFVNTLYERIHKETTNMLYAWHKHLLQTNTAQGKLGGAPVWC